MMYGERRYAQSPSVFLGSGHVQKHLVEIHLEEVVCLLRKSLYESSSCTPGNAPSNGS